MAHILAVDGLSKQFTLHMLQGKTINGCVDVSFTLAPGEFLAVSGPSGNGKSTIIKCIFRTYKPTAGAIRYDSAAFGPIDLATAADQEVAALRKAELGYVSQFLRVIPRVPAVDVVAEPLWVRGASPDDGRRAARDLLLRLGIPAGHLDAYPATFSGGEQQRVGIARAVAAPPRLLLLDEPTASLDGRTRAEVVRLLADLKAAGTSMIGVFHDLETVRPLVDSVLGMDRGRSFVVA